MWRCTGLAVLLCCSCGSNLSEDSSDDSPRTRATPDDPEEEGPTTEVVEQSPPIAWEYRWGSSGQDYVSDIAVDRDGNVYRRLSQYID